MRIYLASPYTHTEDRVRNIRYNRAMIYVNELIQAGTLVFSPILHTHPVATIFRLPMRAQYWEAFNKSWIDWATDLHVLALVGWEKSLGIDMEVAYAKEKGKSIWMVDWPSHELEPWDEV